MFKLNFNPRLTGAYSKWFNVLISIMYSFYLVAINVSALAGC